MSSEKLLRSRTHVVLDVSMPMLVFEKDSYGMTYEFLNPLSFDRTSDSRAIDSASTLFKLPVEILTLILRHIPARSDLTNFAVSSRKCCALARSRLFTEVVLDYSDRSFELIWVLLSEAAERSEGRPTKLPSIGACIRKLTVATNGIIMQARHGIELGDESTRTAATRQEQKERIFEACRTYYQFYTAAISRALQSALPHLAVLQWLDRTVISSEVLKAIPLSTVKHLVLHRVQVDESFDLIQYLEGSTLDAQWQLQSLSIDMVWAILSDKDEQPVERESLVRDSLFAACASTLESLSWSGLNPKLNSAVRLPAFTRLRKLQLESFNLPDQSHLQALLPVDQSCRIRTLSIYPDSSPAATQFFMNRGRVISLREFVWKTLSLPEFKIEERNDGGLSFLQANPQISKFRMGPLADADLLNETIVPLLSEHFSKLTSLSLTWNSTSIPATSLTMLAGLTSLEQLHLSAGEQNGWRHNWIIDHALLTQALQPLQRLKTIAFSRDTYNPGYTRVCNAGRQYIDGYYQNRHSKHFIRQLNKLYDPDFEEENNLDSAEGTGGNGVPEGVAARPDGNTNESYNPEQWEREHVQRMTIHAKLYFETFPELTHIYMGQLPVKCPKDQESFIFDGGRDSCTTWLAETFGNLYADD